MKVFLLLAPTPKLITIIFQNLLSNSVKYTNAGGKICLTVGKEGDTMLITVSDDGIGIPKDQQEGIFKKLFRADTAKTIDPDGAGLGLYIVKEIIDHSGGKVWFESPASPAKRGEGENKGTTFYASLPLSGMLERTSSKKLI